jgi:hypothetical protein
MKFTRESSVSCDNGSITAMVVCLIVTFIACAGLVLDGGRLVGARSRAAGIALAAARDGVQEVHHLREGVIVVNVAAAERRARSFLEVTGGAGSVVATEHTVTVTVSIGVAPLLLGVIGVGRRTVRVTRTATPVDH